jgi:hypothetical protein
LEDRINLFKARMIACERYICLHAYGKPGKDFKSWSDEPMATIDSCTTFNIPQFLHEEWKKNNPVMEGDPFYEGPGVLHAALLAAGPGVYPHALLMAESHHAHMTVAPSTSGTKIEKPMSFFPTNQGTSRYYSRQQQLCARPQLEIENLLTPWMMQKDPPLTNDVRGTMQSDARKNLDSFWDWGLDKNPFLLARLQSALSPTLEDECRARTEFFIAQNLHHEKDQMTLFRLATEPVRNRLYTANTIIDIQKEMKQLLLKAKNHNGIKGMVYNHEEAFYNNLSKSGKTEPGTVMDFFL